MNINLRSFNIKGRPLSQAALFIIIVLLCSIQSFGQSYYFDQYSVKEGLGDSKVYDIIQGENDYLWMGTLSGVSCFDGIKFKNFTSQDGLADNGVRAIYQDNDKNIWFGHTGGGVTRFDGKTFESLDITSITFSSDVTSIIQDKKDNLWITTAESGAVKISNPNAAVQEIRYEQYKGKRLSDRVYSSLIMSDEKLYFITDIGIKRYVENRNTFEHFQLKNLPKYFQITTMFEDNEENIWFGTYHGGLYKYIKDEKRFIIYDIRDGLSSNWISTIAEDSKGSVWVGTWGGGITRFTGDKMMVFDTENGLNGNKIWSIIEDVEGNVIIGTTDHGFSIFKGEAFVAYTKKEGLANEQVWDILKDRNGRYWFATNEGITIFSGHDPKNIAYYNNNNQSISNQIRYLEQDIKGDIWIGTEDMGIYQYTINNGSFIYNNMINRYFPHNSSMVTGLALDDHNNLWIGTIDGLINYEINNHVGTRITQIDGLAGNEITCLYVDDQQVLWIGAKGKGLTRCARQGGSYVFTINRALKNNTPKCMVKDKQGRLWVGTEGQGLYVIKNNKVVLKYSTENGLLANLITLLEIDDQNNIYVGTNKGLNKIDQNSDKIFTYTEKNGFTGIETKDNASYHGDDGFLWFGTVHGVMRYDPLKDKVKNIDPLTHIRAMRVNLEEQEMTKGLQLGYKENSIIFDYYSICFTNPDAVRYQVMLEGADNNWQPATKQTMVKYAALPPGKYTFKVKASNSIGLWDREPEKYSFIIKPPFWQTWWFISIMVIVGLTGIFLFIKIREQQLVKEKRVLEEKVAERTAEVVQKSRELEEKNKNITDSIRYAKRIQFAILPPEVPFSNTFVLFKPKDIVSGDFYWLLKEGDKEFFAAVDCTGHGVPGAFMSIIGHNSLNKIVKEYNIHQPSKILDQLDKEVSYTFHQQDFEGFKTKETVKDGMDMALICYDTKKHTLEYAGAFNPLYLVRAGELKEIKGDRFAIGQSEDMTNKQFTNHKFQVKNKDTIYIFSDGYADQFGGEMGKKFKSKPMKELLLNICKEDIPKQKMLLDNTIEKWRGDFEQVDDILFIGRRFII